MHAAADFLEAVSNSILAEIKESLWKARLAPPPRRLESSTVTRTGEYMLTILLGEYLPGAFPPSAANRTKFGKGLLNDGWRGLSVTSGGVLIVLRDRSFSIQPAGAAAPFCSREIYTAPMEWPTYELEGLRPRRHLPDDAAFTAAEENPVLVNRWEICCMICSSIECRVGVSQI